MKTKGTGNREKYLIFFLTTVSHRVVSEFHCSDLSVTVVLCGSLWFSGFPQCKFFKRKPTPPPPRRGFY
jgi:hypothetical protein